ncbi:hypothetical protein JAAARDRAFT_51745 [Jaapia argillacea MUCL 33604]|uniref:Uncharacterized protein n=1 Tax=Jaapia argillacea MUCL 33604 TaxID=933084 RepID=A0A067PEQ4_9AGAM|nr:hypothetical protein JAAARDRAFT_51745 [Jaapia argillacea MUCL 33604]
MGMRELVMCESEDAWEYTNGGEGNSRGEHVKREVSCWIDEDPLRSMQDDSYGGGKVMPRPEMNKCVDQKYSCDSGLFSRLGHIPIESERRCSGSSSVAGMLAAVAKQCSGSGSVAGMLAAVAKQRSGSGSVAGMSAMAAARLVAIAGARWH